MYMFLTGFFVAVLDLCGLDMCHMLKPPRFATDRTTYTGLSFYLIVYCTTEQIRDVQQSQLETII